MSDSRRCDFTTCDKIIFHDDLNMCKKHKESLDSLLIGYLKYVVYAKDVDDKEKKIERLDKFESNIGVKK